MRRAGGLAAVHGPKVVTAHPDEPLRVVVYRMAETGHTRLPVVSRGPEGKLLGVHPMHLLFPPRSAREEERARAAS